jgi:threonine synthase
MIPSGNLGNATAALWARRTGLPVGRIILAMNANRTVAEYFETGEWKPRPAVPTLANAMDVGDPSNMERIRDLSPELSRLREGADVVSVSDDEIRETIREEFQQRGEIWCPHTATAVYAAKTLPRQPTILVATASPAKFDTIVEPLIGKKVDIPEPLARILAQPSHVQSVDPTLKALQQALN